MKNYLQVTTKYLKVQKKRSILTIIGVILSLALISGLATMLYSYRDYRIDDAKKFSGNFEVSFKQLNKNQLDIVKNHTAFSSVGINEDIGFAKIYTTPKENITPNVPTFRYLSISAYDNICLNKIFKPTLISGRYPKNKNELVVEKSSLRFLGENIKVGSTLKFPLGMRKSKRTGEPISSDYEKDDEVFVPVKNIQYTLVGIVESSSYNSSYSSFKAISFLDSKDILSSNLSKGTNFNTFMDVNSKKNKRTLANNIAKELNLEQNKESEHCQIKFNNELLRLYAQGSNPIKNGKFTLIVLFIAAIIVLCTIAVIYNSFNISVLERISQFGILRSIGATPNQIRKIVFREASIISLIGIPIGIISGVVAIKIVLLLVGEFFMDSFDPFKVLIYPEVIIISIIIGTITIFFSALGPAIFAGRVSPLEAVKNSKVYNISKVSKGRLSKLAFKFEGNLAYKNLTRNKKRFFITVFSLTISIIMFITFNSFINFVSIADKRNKPMNFDAHYSKEEPIKENEFKDIAKQNEVETIYKFIDSDLIMPIPEDKINKNYSKKTSSTMDDSSIGSYKLSRNSSLIAYDDSLVKLSKQHIISGNIKDDKLNDSEVILVNKNKAISYAKQNKQIIEDFTNYKVGDTINFPKLKSYEYNENLEKDIKDAVNKNNFYKLKVVAIIDCEALLNRNPQEGIFLITSPQTYKKIIGNLKFHRIYMKLKANADRENFTNYFEKKIQKSGGNYQDSVKIAQDNKKAAFQFSVFAYGFITVISIIAMVNIVNTISTNLLIRKREFATLKAVGMSQFQVKKMVFFEGVFHGLIAAFFGSIIGSVLSYILFKISGGISDMSWMIPWSSILISSICAIALTVLSSLIPLRKINHQNIIENIRAEE